MVAFIIFIIAYILRISQVIHLFPSITGDALVYDGLGKDIMRWGIFTSEMLQKFPLKDHPIYPIFLGIIYSVFGRDLFYVLVFQALIGALASVFVYLISREFFDSTVALISGTIAACYPVFIKLSNMLLSEGLYVFLFILSIWLIIKYMKSMKLYFLALSAIFLGLTILTRSVAILFIFLLIPYLFFYQRNKIKLKQNIFNLVLFFLIFVCSILPWSIRNYYISGGYIIPVTGAPVGGLYVSFCPYKGKIFGIRPDDDPVMVEARKISSFKERNKLFFSKTIEFIKNNPRRVIKLEVLKIAYLWSPFDWEILGDGQARYNFGFVFILPFFIYGTVGLIRQKQLQSLILFLPIFYFQFIHLIYFALPRFRIGFEPFFIIIVAYGMRVLYGKVQRKRLLITVISLFLICNVILFFKSYEIKIFLREICRNIGIW